MSTHDHSYDKSLLGDPMSADLNAIAKMLVFARRSAEMARDSAIATLETAHTLRNPHLLDDCQATIQSSRAVVRMLALVSDLFQISSGEATFEPRPIDLNEEVDRSLFVLRVALQRAGTAARTTTAPTRVLTDQRRIDDIVAGVFDHLVQHFVDSEEEGGVHIQVAPDGDMGRMSVDIVSSHTAFTDAVLERVHRPFHTLPLNRLLVETMALDLARARLLAEHQGGRLAIGPIRDGMRIDVLLPLAS